MDARVRAVFQTLIILLNSIKIGKGISKVNNGTSGDTFEAPRSSMMITTGHSGDPLGLARTPETSKHLHEGPPENW